MIGGIIGDVLGSTYEFKKFIIKNRIRFKKNSRPTDDTICMIAISKALLNYLDIDTYQIKDAANENNFIRDCVSNLDKYCNEYPNAGYGTKFKEWLRMENKIPYNSFGNGAAMRVAPVGWYANTLDDCMRIATLTALPSHNHEEGIKGARAIASSIFLLRNGASKRDLLQFVENKFEYDITNATSTILFNDSCQITVPQAIRAFLDSDSYMNTLLNAISMGGDTDTVACMAGSIAEAYFDIPTSLISNTMSIIRNTTNLTDDDFEFYTKVVLPLKDITEQSKHYNK
jgi:ADP-ribosylglycohydrolase